VQEAQHEVVTVVRIFTTSWRRGRNWTRLSVTTPSICAVTPSRSSLIGTMRVSSS
jgi:hypothetical protein